MGLSLKPLADRVVVYFSQPKINPLGELYYPTQPRKNRNKERVVAVGPGKASDSGSLIEMTVKNGDKVLYGKYSGSEIALEGTDYIIMRESDILAVL